MQHEQSEPLPSPTLPTDRRSMLAGIGGLAAGALLVGKASAGPLDPPSGPIAPTPGPEPRIAINQTNTPGDASATYKITQPGSYYLTENLVGESGKNGILITVDRVSIDLQGFAIKGVSSSLNGIFTQGSRKNLTIRNGSVMSWGAAGIDLSNSEIALYILIEDIVSFENSGAGIHASGSVRVHNCIAANNGGDGIALLTLATRPGVISACVSRGNTGPGIRTGFSSTVTDCVVEGNASPGIQAGSRSLIHRCNSSSNSARGMEVGEGSTVSESTIAANLGNEGIVVGEGCTIHTCTIANNANDGISAGLGSNIIACSAHKNLGYGIITANGCTIRECSVHDNRDAGILASSRNTIESNTVTENGYRGIIAASDCTIRNNSCVDNRDQNNLGAGIRVTGAGNRIESNHLILNAPGIEVTGGSNLIFQNSARANTPNYSIVGGNTFGPLINAGNISTSSNPHGNYDF